MHTANFHRIGIYSNYFFNLIERAFNGVYLGILEFLDTRDPAFLVVFCLRENL